MDLRDSPEESAFRKEVATFIADEAPKAKQDVRGMAGLAGGMDANQAWFQKLTEKVCIAPDWPE